VGQSNRKIALILLPHYLAHQQRTGKFLLKLAFPKLRQLKGLALALKEDNMGTQERMSSRQPHPLLAGRETS
jgi:hypothetical protein